MRKRNRIVVIGSANMDVVAGAICVTRRGAQASLPDRDALDRFLGLAALAIN